MNFELSWHGQTLKIVDRDIKDAIERVKAAKTVGRWRSIPRTPEVVVYVGFRPSFFANSDLATTFLESVGRYQIKSITDQAERVVRIMADGISKLPIKTIKRDHGPHTRFELTTAQQRILKEVSQHGDKGIMPAALPKQSHGGIAKLLRMKLIEEFNGDSGNRYRVTLHGDEVAASI